MKASLQLWLSPTLLLAGLCKARCLTATRTHRWKANQGTRTLGSTPPSDAD